MTAHLKSLHTSQDGPNNFTNAGKGLVLFESAAGFDWKLSAQSLLTTPEIAWTNGVRQKLYSLERPQLWFEKDQPPFYSVPLIFHPRTNIQTMYRSH